MVIAEHHVEHWRHHGYAIVEGFLSPSDVEAAWADLHEFLPTREQYASAPGWYGNDPGGGYSREFPFLGDFVNAMAVHPELVSFVERALGTRDLSLTQSIVWAKYGGGDDYEQPLHADYMNHSLLYPRFPAKREEVLFLLYYSDIDDTLGPTYVVSKEHTREELLVPYRRSREQFPDLYALERPVHLPAGSLLAYDTSTFHRGSRMSAPDGLRVSHHIVYRVNSAPWIGYRHWGNYGLSLEMQSFVEGASPRQRELIGIPPVGHGYWDETTMVGMAARYAGMDMTPYVEAAPLEPDAREAVTRRLTELRSHGPRETGVVSAPQPAHPFWSWLAAVSPGVAAFWKPWVDYWAAASLEARERAAAERAPGGTVDQLTTGQAHAYLDLLAKTLARYPLRASDRLLLGALRGIDHPSCREITRWHLVNTWGLGREMADPEVRGSGMDWPADAETMIGLTRLHNVQACARDVLRRGVAGDFMETGVWRGGACIYMRAILAALGDRGRRVWVADSFQGVPSPDPRLYRADFGDTLFTYSELAVSLATVQANFRRYGFLDAQVHFLPGWFRDTLPQASVEQLALLRLDGDLYESTIIALRSLYPKVSPGGYVIVDDYGGIASCRQAVDDFRAEFGIDEPLQRIDWAGVFWQVRQAPRPFPSVESSPDPGDAGRGLPRVVWFDLGIDEPERAQKFYSEVFGWKVDRLPGALDYWLLSTGEDRRPGIDGGLVQRRYPTETTTCWIEVPSVDECLARIVEHGGVALTPKAAGPGGAEYVYCQDTEGNVLGLIRRGNHVEGAS